MLQCVAVRCSQPHQAFRVVFRPPLACMMCRNVLQCFAVLCSALQYVAVWWSVSQCVAVHIIRILELCLVSRWPVCFVAMCCCRELQSISSTCLHCVSSPTSLYDVVQCVSVCCSVLECITVHIIKILEFRVVFHWPVWCVAVCCSVLQCVAVSINKILQLCLVSHSPGVVQCIASVAKRVCWSMLERVAARCSVLQRVAACYSVLQCAAVCYRQDLYVCHDSCVCMRDMTHMRHMTHELLCVAVCCSVLQWLAVTWLTNHITYTGATRFMTFTPSENKMLH